MKMKHVVHLQIGPDSRHTLHRLTTSVCRRIGGATATGQTLTLTFNNGIIDEATVMDAVSVYPLTDDMHMAL